MLWQPAILNSILPFLSIRDWTVLQKCCSKSLKEKMENNFLFKLSPNDSTTHVVRHILASWHLSTYQQVQYVFDSATQFVIRRCVGGKTNRNYIKSTPPTFFAFHDENWISHCDKHAFTHFLQPFVEFEGFTCFILTRDVEIQLLPDKTQIIAAGAMFATLNLSDHCILFNAKEVLYCNASADYTTFIRQMVGLLDDAIDMNTTETCAYLLQWEFCCFMVIPHYNEVGFKFLPGTLENVSTWITMLQQFETARERLMHQKRFCEALLIETETYKDSLTQHIKFIEECAKPVLYC